MCRYDDAIANIISSFSIPHPFFLHIFHQIWPNLTGRLWLSWVAGPLDLPGQLKSKGKVLPYWLPSIEPGAHPGVQAVSPQVTSKSFPGSRLPLLSARPAVTYPAKERHHPLTSTKLHCLVTEVHRCERLAQCCYTAAHGENQTHDLMVTSPSLYR